MTYINNDFTLEEDGGSKDVDGAKWDSGQHSDETPKHDKPRPKKFKFEVEYNTFEDKIYKLTDLTVRSFVRLGHRIGQEYPKSASDMDDFEDEEASDSDDDDDDDYDSDDDLDVTKKKKHKKGKKKHRKGKTNKAWLHFLKHAFVSTRSEDDLRKEMD